MRNSHRGFTLVEIMVVVAVIGLLAGIAIPSFVRARNTAQQNACINNLRVIESGKDQAALALKWLEGTETDSITNKPIVNSYIKGNTVPECPAGGFYTYNMIVTSPVCSVVSPTIHALR